LEQTCSALRKGVQERSTFDVDIDHRQYEVPKREETTMSLTMFAPIYRGDQPMPTRWFGMDAPEPMVEFGRFRVLPRRRQLLADGVPVELGTRAYDILLTLIEANGLLVTKDELFNRVWPGRIVEEGNLQVQVLALRKALGADRDLIRTDYGRGYRLIGAVRRGTTPMPAWV
jgi:DNA-binding winged helix-turn-helix (wHTH) protein